MKTKKLISWLLTGALAVGAAALPAGAEEPVGWVPGINRAAENLSLSRGLTAVKLTDGVFLSWRLFDTEDDIFGTSSSNVTFNVYKNGSLIAENLNNTSYTDISGITGDSYSVAPIINGIEGEKCTETTPLNDQYFDISLNVPDDAVGADGNTYSYFPGDASCGDLDGDGEYEIILKWDANPQDNSHNGYTGNVLLDAYELDGTFLWRIDLGLNIRSGAHYTQFMVYDLDGDGKAEICCKTAPGSKDSAGVYVTEASLDEDVKAADNTAVYVDSGGRISTGPEYYTVFGSDGRALDTIPYLYDRNSGSGFWGVDSGGKVDMWNRPDRYLGAIAYLDGVHPSVVTVRGYYDRTTLAAYTLENGRLKLTANFDTDDINGQYIGQGNHNITVADVDNDGRDEILTGSVCFNDDLSVLWCSGRGHGDALHIGDYDPTHEGYEYFSVHEGGGYTITQSTTSSQGKEADYGMTVYDAETGEELAHSGNNDDTGRGVMANVGAGGYYQFWGAGTYQSNGGTDMSSVRMRGASSNFRIYWDGDLYDELLDGTSITSWNGSRMSEIFNARNYDCVQINGTKANPVLQADLFGDWREEVVYPTWDGSTLRIFTTTESTDYKMKSLMYDSVYRAGVAAEQVAYNQPPHLGYYMDEESFSRKATHITVEPSSGLTYKYGEPFDINDITVTVYYEDGTNAAASAGSITISDYDPTYVGTQTVTVTSHKRSAEITVEVTIDFTVEDGIVTGYTGTDESAAIPSAVNGEPVTAIADGALYESSLSEITIPPSITSIGENALNSDITVRCVEGSYAHSYALENGLNYILSKEMLESLVSVTYDEDEYANISNMIQSTTTQTVTVGDVTYTVGGRNGSGDGGTGFTFNTDSDGNKYVTMAAGRFSNANRHAYMTFDSLPQFNSGSDYVMSMKISFNDTADATEIQLAVTNGENPSNTEGSAISVDSYIDVITREGLGLEFGVQYIYSLISHNGNYYRAVQTSDGGILSVTDLQKSSDGTSPSFIGAYQLGIGNGSTVSVNIDDIEIYSCINGLSDTSIRLIDETGAAMAGASVKINGIKYTADDSGVIDMGLIPVGNYSFTAPAYNITTSEYISEISREITLTAKEGLGPEPEVTWNIEKAESGFAPVTGDTASVSVDLTSENPGTIIAAVYQNGTLLSIDIEKSASAVFTDFPDGFDPDSEVLVKIFVWYDTDSLVPMCGTVQKVF